MVKRRAPTGCYWRGRILYGRVAVNGREYRWPLHTDNPAIARARYKAGKERLIADTYHGDAPRLFVEALEGWAPWIKRRVGSAATVQRYACSLDQQKDFLDGKRIADIDGRLIADIIRARSADGVTNATIKRDLVALSSVINYAIGQGWIESNPVLARMRALKERRDPIILPRCEDIERVIERAPGMIKDMIRVAMATGMREEELRSLHRDAIDHQRRVLTFLGKGNRRRTIDLEPFGGYGLIRSLPSYVGSPFLFWHSAGEDYKNLASQFSAIVRRVADPDFRPFRFHDLRHWHAVEWLRSGRSIYALQHRLGHASIKTTEGYLRAGYLMLEEQEAVKAGAQVAQSTAQVPHRGTEAS